MRNRNLYVRRNVRNNKNALVESIMSKIAPIVMNAINEAKTNEKKHIIWTNDLDDDTMKDIAEGIAEDNGYDVEDVTEEDVYEYNRIRQ